jgi:choline-phosphate cytidylyltransferase
VQDLRDNIRANWATTGQELSRELRQFWPTSRPQSPARPASLLRADSSNGNGSGNEAASPSSPLGPGAGLGFFGPRSPGAAAGGERGNGNDFITGYTLGLIGGVRSWVSDSFPTGFADSPSFIILRPFLRAFLFAMSIFSFSRHKLPAQSKSGLTISR